MPLPLPRAPIRVNSMPAWSAGTQRLLRGLGALNWLQMPCPWECGAHRHARGRRPPDMPGPGGHRPSDPGPGQGRICRGRICVTAVSSEVSREAGLVSDPHEDAFLPDVAERPVQALPQLGRPPEAGPSGIKGGSTTHSLGPLSAEPPPSASGPRGCGRCCRWKRLDGTRCTRGASLPMAPPTSQRIA